MSLFAEVGRRMDGMWSALRGVPTASEREAMQLRSVYTGAVTNRLFSDWIAPALPSDQELITDLRLLRSRCRDIGRNNPFGVRFLELVQENMVGPNGIDAQPAVVDDSGEPFTAFNRYLHDRWLDFCENASVDGRLHLTDFTLLGAASIAQDGENFVRFVRGPEFKHGLALQAIDPDLVDEAYNMPRHPLRAENEVRLSVEVDRYGRRVRYRVYEEPGTFGSRGTNPYWISAGDMLHLGRAKRLNQTRFVPWFHPVMDAIFMLDKLAEAELVASRSAAAKMGFLVTEKGGTQLGEKRPDGTRAPVPMEASPGSLATLPPGVTFQGWDPQHPTTAFATFHAAMVRRIAAGLGIAYTSLANDPGDANYSSSRSALQMEQRFWRKLQGIWVRQLMQPLYDEWLRMAQLTGQVNLGRMDFARVRRVKWETTGWDWIDPKSDVEAAVLAIQNNLDSPQRIASLRGLDFEEDIIVPRRQARQMIEAAGLEPPAASGGATPNADTQPGRTNDRSASSDRGAPPAPSRNGSAARESVAA